MQLSCYFYSNNLSKAKPVQQDIKHEKNGWPQGKKKGRKQASLISVRQESKGLKKQKVLHNSILSH